MSAPAIINSLGQTIMDDNYPFVNVSIRNIDYIILYLCPLNAIRARCHLAKRGTLRPEKKTNRHFYQNYTNIEFRSIALTTPFPFHLSSKDQNQFNGNIWIYSIGNWKPMNQPRVNGKWKKKINLYKFNSVSRLKAIHIINPLTYITSFGECTCTYFWHSCNANAKQKFSQNIK